MSTTTTISADTPILPLLQQLVACDESQAWDVSVATDGSAYTGLRVTHGGRTWQIGPVAYRVRV